MSRFAESNKNDTDLNNSHHHHQHSFPTEKTDKAENHNHNHIQIESPSAFLSNMIYSSSETSYAKKISIHQSNRRKSGTSGVMGVLSHHSSSKAKEIEEKEEMLREKKNLETVWLLAGCNRWTKANDPEDTPPASVYRKPKAAAHISLTSPTIAVDVGSEAGTSLSLEGKNIYSWQVDETSSIKSLKVNSSESILLSSSKSGVNIWGLSCHPIRNLGTYSRHSFSAFSMDFLNNGSQVASCDGNINVWDLETKTTIGYVSPFKGALNIPFIYLSSSLLFFFFLYIFLIY
jgi:hypothetical protein